MKMVRLLHCQTAELLSGRADLQCEDLPATGGQALQHKEKCETVGGFGEYLKLYIK